MIPAEHAHLIIATATHPGRRGKQNEDRYSVSAYHLAPDDPTPSVVALLADGIGGHHAGEIAAELAVRSINQFIAESTVSQPVLVLKRALTHANQVILNRVKDDSSLVGMGTTCVCAWVIADRLFAASVGDSRLYLQRGDQILRLTTDHTWIQEALSQGTLKPSEIKGHPNAHIIRRFLGSLNAITPDVRLRLSTAESDLQAEANQGMRLLPGDRLVLSSDGLTDLVRDEEILDLLRTSPLELCLTQLINLANQRGGHDNITIVLLEVPRPAYEIRKTPSPRPARTAASWWMLALLLVAIIMTILLLVYTYIY